MLIRHNEDDLDKVFRQKLYNAQEEVPLHLWEGIRQKNTRKRRALIWWWVLPVAILTIGAAAYVLHSDNSETIAIAQLATEKKTSATVVFDNNVNKTNEATNSRQENRSVKSQPSSVIEKNNQPKKSGLKGLTNSNNKMVVFEKETAQSTNTKFDSGKSYISPKMDDAVSQDLILVPDLDSSETKKQTSLSISLKESIEQDVFSGDMPFIEPTASKIPSRWSLDLYYVLSQPMRIKQPNAQSDTYTQFVDRTQLGLSHGTGILLSYSLPWNVQISMGIEYQRFHERHDWIDSTLVQKKTYVFDYDTTSTLTGTTITQYVMDSVETNEWKTQSNSRINRYSSVNIPVLLSWSHSFKKYSLGLEVGPLFRIQSIYNGEFVFADWQSLPPTTDIWTEADEASAVMVSKRYEVPTTQVYRSWRTDLHLGIHQSYSITSRMAASLSLQTRIMMNEPRTASNMAHRIIQPGVRVGLNYLIK